MGGRVVLAVGAEWGSEILILCGASVWLEVGGGVQGGQVLPAEWKDAAGQIHSLVGRVLQAKQFGLYSGMYFGSQSLVYIRSGGGACFNSRFLNPLCRNSDSKGQGVDPEICILIITPFTGWV